MGDNFNDVKNKMVNTVKRIFKLKIKIIVIILIFILILLSAAVYWLTIDDGTYKEDDWSNTPYAASQYTNNFNVENDGKLTTSMTAQELWDKMIENGSRVDDYLDSPEELVKLMNAEVITQYLDTRPNPDAEIDWDTINDVNSKEIQGIIKLKRADINGNINTLTYVDPNTFQSYIEDYNKSGSEEIKKKALSHFTLEKTETSSSGNSSDSSNIGIIEGDGTFTQYTDLTDAQIKAIANLCKQEQGSLKGAAAEASLMANRFEMVGSKFGTGGSGLYNYVRTSGWFANAAHFMDNGSAGTDYVKVVKAVLVNGKRTLPKYVDEHDCFSDITSATNKGSSIDVSDRSQYKQNVTKMKNRYSSSYTFYCFPTDTSDPFGYISTANRRKYGDAYYDFDSGELINGKGTSADNSPDDKLDNKSNNNSDGWCWPTDGDRITSTFGPRSAPVPGASTDHGAIDIGVPEGTNVYACDDGKVTIAGWSDSAGNWVVIDHGNGYVTKYMHNSKLEVSQGDKVTKGQVIAKSGNTGHSSGPHVHFQVEYNGEKKDPLTFKYYNSDKGDGSNSVSSSENNSKINNEKSENTKYYAKVATWSEDTHTVESNDSETAPSSSTTYNMTTTNINYQEVVSGYTMPFNYLWALLVVGDDKDFVLDLADLVYDSELEITVHDNLTVNTNTVVNTYTKKKKTETEAQVTVKDESSIGIIETVKDNWVDEESKDYNVTETTITKTNTLDIALTKANTWIVNYSQEYKYQQPQTTTTNNLQTLESKDYPSEPDETSNSDTYGHANALLESQKNKYLEEYPNLDGIIDYVQAKIYNATVNRNVNTTNVTETTKYISSPAKNEEKTDKDAQEDNFVTLLEKDENRKAKLNILSVEDWLFEILENNDDTKDMVDLTKYLLYKLTGISYGVDEYDFGAYEPSGFVEVSDDSDIVGNSIEEKVWFALIDKGFSEYATAGVMGNIYGESGFNPELVEAGYDENNGGIGLCQWTNYPRNSGKGSNANLKKYAQSKGATWKDASIQINFLLTGVTGTGDAKGYTNKSFMSNSMYGRRYTESDWKNAKTIEDATKAFCATFERPGVQYFYSSMDKRVTAAKKYYDQFHGKDRPISDNESGGNQNIVSTAKSKIGCPYVWGASGPNSFDCSGFVYWVYQKNGIVVPRGTDGYMSYRGSKKEISWNQAKPGDILIICKDEGDRWKYGCGHAGIYLGGDKYIHSPTSGKTVTIVNSGAKTRFTHVFRFK